MPDNHLVPHQAHQSFIDIATIRGALFRQRWLIGGTLLVAAIAGLVWTLLATPMYEARSTVRIEPFGSFIVPGQDVDPGIASNQVYDMLQTQLAIITSRSLANTVAENLDLGEREDFLGEDVDQQRPPNLTDEQWHDAKQAMAAARLHGSVSAEMPDRNWIIEIAYRSESPAIAAEMANAYSAAYAASDIQESVETNEYAQDYLREQIQRTRARLQEAEQAANAYARANGLIIQPSGGEESEGNMTLTTTNLASINARVSQARAARIEAEQRWRSIQALPIAELVEVQNNPLLQGLIAERASKQSELAELRQRFYDAHPRVAAVIAQIETLDRQIEQSGADVKAAARTEYLVARNQEQALEQELASVTGSTLAEQDRQVEYSVLEREAQALRDQLQALLNRFNQVSTAANVRTGTIIPLDPAVVPQAPYAPSLLRNMMMALVLGGALAAGLAVLREVIDDKVRSFDEVENKIGLPLLGHTPFVEQADLATEGADRYGPLIDAYGSIRSTIDFILPRDPTVVQFTSSQAAEGKSTTVMILAELFAGHGRKTLLIDGDLRRPSFPRLLGLERSKHGLVEVLLGEADLQSAIVKGRHENLDILPAGRTHSNPTEILASRHLRDFLEERRQEYSLIIFDSAPVLGLADAPMLANIADGTIFVMEANGVNFRQVRAALKRLRASGGNPIGAIVTKYQALQAGQSYDYQYAYYEYGNSR